MTVLLLFLSKENIRNSGVSYARLMPTENGVTPAAIIHQAFKELQVFLMATGECSARGSIILLRTTSHRRCENHSDFRKFERDNYLLYFLITESYTVWK